MKSFGKRLAAAFCLLGMMATQDIGAKNVVITEYGAVADSTTLNTVAIQQAIDACAESGGGTVTVPTGIFMTGAINLRSNVELYLERGATLRGSLRIPEDFYRPTVEIISKLQECAGRNIYVMPTVYSAYQVAGHRHGRCERTPVRVPLPPFGKRLEQQIIEVAPNIP